MMDESNIRPHQFYNGSFDIRFRGWSDKKIKNIGEELSHWMKEKSYDPTDKSWAIGWLVVADLIYEGRQEDLIEKLEGFTRVLQVCVD